MGHRLVLLSGLLSTAWSPLCAAPFVRHSGPVFPMCSQSRPPDPCGDFSLIISPQHPFYFWSPTVVQLTPVVPVGGNAPRAGRQPRKEDNNPYIKDTKMDGMHNRPYCVYNISGYFDYAEHWVKKCKGRKTLMFEAYTTALSH
ncbi:hypothetical protein B0J17DRAFT_629364 [Rhizoctonia solani]|nr:hypothetical protein B0J17DRAFT_629364 [Rhizoctonia solani]